MTTASEARPDAAVHYPHTMRAQRQKESENRRWWLNVPLLTTGAVAIMVLAAIGGSLGTREARANGNPYWRVFLTQPVEGLDGLGVIGTWRKDPLPGDGAGPRHCGIKIYALPPENLRRLFDGPAESHPLWRDPVAIEPINAATRMSAGFCGGSVQVMPELFERIQAAWNDVGNERFCAHHVVRDGLFAGVIDRRTGRVYTWFTAASSAPLPRDRRRRLEAAPPDPMEPCPPVAGSEAA